MESLIYEKELRIRSEQVDMARRLRMSELFRMLEEATIAHTEELGCTRDKTLDRGLLWIITRQMVEIEEMPEYDDVVTLRTWQGTTMHVIFPRFYEIIRNGRCVIRGEALWMLIDEDTRDMVMPEVYDIFIPGVRDSEDILLPAIMIPSDAEGPFISEEMTTQFSQVDINGHMNNTSYFDIIDDALVAARRTAPPEGHRRPLFGAAAKAPAVPRRVLANYQKELVLGEPFTLKEYVSGNTRYIEGKSWESKFRIMLEY